MKKRISFLVVILSLILVGCANQNKENVKNEEKKEEKKEINYSAVEPDIEKTFESYINLINAMAENDHKSFETSKSELKENVANSIVDLQKQEESALTADVGELYALFIEFLDYTDSFEGDDSASKKIGAKIKDISDKYNDGVLPNAIKKLKEAPEENGNKELKVGETMIYDSGIKITVNSVSVSPDEPNGEIKGNFVKVDFTIDNGSDEDFRFNTHNLELYDGDRNKAELDSKEFYSESIAKGMKSSGVAYFDAQEKNPYTVIIGAGVWKE